jgi:hypothetical protein
VLVALFVFLFLSLFVCCLRGWDLKLLSKGCSPITCPRQHTDPDRHPQTGVQGEGLCLLLCLFFFAFCVRLGF